MDPTTDTQTPPHKVADNTLPVNQDNKRQQTTITTAKPHPSDTQSTPSTQTTIPDTQTSHPKTPLPPERLQTPAYIQSPRPDTQNKPLTRTPHPDTTLPDTQTSHPKTPLPPGHKQDQTQHHTQPCILCTQTSNPTLGEDQTQHPNLSCRQPAPHQTLITDTDRRGQHPKQRPGKGIEEVTYKTIKKVTARDTTKNKTPMTAKTRKKRLMTADPKQRKIGYLLTFWQGSIRPRKKPDSPHTEEGETRTRQQGRTVAPDLDLAENLTVESTVTPDSNIVKRLTAKRGGPDIVAEQDRQRDSPTKTRIQEIRQKFRTRLTDTATQRDQTQTRPPPATESKRKADTESSSRPPKLRVTAERRGMDSREGRAASNTGPIYKYFNTNSARP